MKRRKGPESLKWRSITFFSKFFKEETQLKMALRLIDDEVNKIITEEIDLLKPRETRQAFLYWNSFMQMVRKAHSENNTKVLKVTYNLIESIIDEQSFNSHLFRVGDMICAYGVMIPTEGDEKHED